MLNAPKEEDSLKDAHLTLEDRHTKSVLCLTADVHFGAILLHKSPYKEFTNVLSCPYFSILCFN